MSAAHHKQGLLKGPSLVRGFPSFGADPGEAAHLLAASALAGAEAPDTYSIDKHAFTTLLALFGPYDTHHSLVPLLTTHHTPLITTTDYILHTTYC